MPTVDVRITSMYPPGEVGSIRGYASATIDSLSCNPGNQSSGGRRAWALCFHAQAEDNGRI